MAGTVLGWVIGSSSVVESLPPAPGEPARPASPSTSPEVAAGRRGFGPAKPEDTSAQPSRALVPELISPELRDFATAEVQRGWSSVRQDAMPDDQMQRALATFDRSVRAWPYATGKRLAREQQQRDRSAAALAAADGVRFLAALTEDDPLAAEVVRDEARFAAFFRPRTGGPTVGWVPSINRIDDQLQDGTIVSFGRGVFQVRGLMRNKDPFPADVTLRGAGMNATLLVLNELYTSGPLQRFSIEDCTVYTSNYLTDLRSQPAVMSFARVRFTGFDIGAGASVCFGVPRAAILARNCRFEGGYGRNPGSGTLFQASGFLLCRFERCSFSRISMRYLYHVTGVFRDCVMTELLEPLPKPPSVRFEGCQVDVLDPSWIRNSEALRRDLNDLFPHWQELIGR